ncbi:MAG: putative 2OG-Fe(II) oxygenase [Erythrobacter sp.]
MIFGNGIGPTGSQAVADALQRQLAANPNDRIARHNLAVELRKLCRSDAGLIEIQHAWRQGLRAAETAVVLGNLLADAGQFDEAVEAYREAVRINPELLEPHHILASLLPQLGRGDEALDSLHEALARVPQAGPIWVTALETARLHRRFDQLLEWCEAAHARWGEDPLIEAFKASALSGLGRNIEAIALLDRITSREPAQPNIHATRAHVLLQLGDPKGAEMAAETALQLAPMSQAAWSLLSVAWRLLDDQREYWLCGYEDLVMTVDIGVEPGLKGALEQRHAVSAHPADQSLRGGTQTRGNLFETADPQILELAFKLRDAVEARIARLPRDAAHPFAGRNSGSVSFPTSWSVRLRSEGHHVSHIHPVGWMSSAYYVSLPPEVAEGEGQGALTFGVPDVALGLDLPPRRIVQPVEGRLVLFPSYLWHGTTPFSSSEPRVTVAFDTLPVDNGAAPR